MVITDLGTGNLFSVINAIKKIANTAEVVSTRSPTEIRAADRLVLPGQGAIGTWMKALQNDEIRSAMKTHYRINLYLAFALVCKLCIPEVMRMEVQTVWEYCLDGSFASKVIY